MIRFTQYRRTYQNFRVGKAYGAKGETNQFQVQPVVPAVDENLLRQETFFSVSDSITKVRLAPTAEANVPSSSCVTRPPVPCSSCEVHLRRNAPWLTSTPLWTGGEPYRSFSYLKLSCANGFSCSRWISRENGATRWILGRKTCFLYLC